MKDWSRSLRIKVLHTSPTFTINQGWTLLYSNLRIETVLSEDTWWNNHQKNRDYSMWVYLEISWENHRKIHRIIPYKPVSNNHQVVLQPKKIVSCSFYQWIKWFSYEAFGQLVQVLLESPTKGSEIRSMCMCMLCIYKSL